MAITATKVRNVTDGWSGDAALYRLSEAIPFGDGKRTDHVVVSAASVLGEPETYIFPTDDAGKALDWLELDGSFRGALDHSAAIEGAGWEVA